MEAELNFSLMLSLKEISLRRVAVNLWMHSEILTSIHEFVIKDRIRLRSEFKIQDKMTEHQFPPLIVEQVKSIIKPIGLEIRTWKSFHEEHLIISKENLDIRILEQLCWTTLGTVDYRRTAEELIRLKLTDIVGRYRLACLYCLDDDIPVLWDQLPEKNKRYFYPEITPVKLELEFCWPYILKGEGAKLDYLTRSPFSPPTTFNFNLFEYSASKGNKPATEYFFQKLTYDERKVSLLRTAHVVVNRRRNEILSSPKDASRGKLSDTLQYLLCQMSPKQQMKLLKANTCSVLLCLYDWPWQDLFLSTVELMWNFPADFYDYKSFIKNIIRSTEFSDHYFPELFRKLIQNCPINFKRQFVGHEMFGTFLEFIFEAQDSETIEVIFRDLDYKDRKRFVSCENVFEVFYKAMAANRFQSMVNLCFYIAKLSEEDVREIHEAFLGFVRRNSGRRLTRWTVIPT